MTAQALLKELKGRGLRPEPHPNGNLRITPKARLTSELFEAVRQHKSALIAYLHTQRSVTSDSRNALIGSEVRAKIEAIEADARAKGWQAELLWNRGFWDCPRGLAVVLDEGDAIAEVEPDYITILKTQRSLVKFQRGTS